MIQAPSGRNLAEVMVIMPHRGGDHFLKAAVESVLAQDYPALRVVVVDDASPTDVWVDQVRHLARDSRVRFFRTDRNVGPYRIKNRMIKETSSPFIAFQDTDDISHPRRIGLQVRAMERRRIDVLGSSFNEVDADGRFLRRCRMPRHANFWRRLGRRFVLLHGTMVVRKQVLDDLGGFDGTTMVAADTDFTLRAAHAFRIRNLQSYLYNYRRHDQSLSGSLETGFGSPIRSTYMSAALERERARRQLGKSRLSPALLLAPANDIEFEIEEILP
jgi:glycosyltransferase involved in cell wall biosynthesis